MTRLTRILVCIALAIMATGLARADLIVFANATTVGPQGTDVYWNTALGNASSLIFPATTTPAGYKLVSTTLEIWTYIDDPSVNVKDTSTPIRANTAYFTLDETLNSIIESNSVDSTLVGNDQNGTTFDTFTVANPSGRVYFPASHVAETITLAPPDVTYTLDTGAVAVSDPAGYLAGATLTGYTVTNTGFNSTGGNIDLNQTQFATINGQLTFDFQKVPESGAILLLATNFLGLGLGWRLWRRRRTN